MYVRTYDPTYQHQFYKRSESDDSSDSFGMSPKTPPLGKSLSGGGVPVRVRTPTYHNRTKSKPLFQRRSPRSPIKACGWNVPAAYTPEFDLKRENSSTNLLGGTGVLRDEPEVDQTSSPSRQSPHAISPLDSEEDDDICFGLPFHLNKKKRKSDAMVLQTTNVVPNQEACPAQKEAAVVDHRTTMEQPTSPFLRRRRTSNSSIESIDKLQRRPLMEHKISEAILVLRGASERGYSERHKDEEDANNYILPSTAGLQNNHKNTNNSTNDHKHPPHSPSQHYEKGTASFNSTLQSIMGGFGLAFFSPLDRISYEPLEKTTKPTTTKNIAVIQKTESQLTINTEVTTLITRCESDLSLYDQQQHQQHHQQHIGKVVDYDDDDTDECPVQIEPEEISVLKAYPRILTMDMMQQINDKGLPSALQLMSWERVYSLVRDGDSFYTMLQKVQSYRHTIVVIRTREGDILGGYADERWKKQDSFYGGGQSFLFATRPSLLVPTTNTTPTIYTNQEQDMRSKQHNDPISIYKWTGKNSFAQMCDVEQGRLAMGGGGSFGFVVQEHFTRGSTGHCNTFDNPPLAQNSPNGIFSIVDFEVYGFLSMGSSGSFRDLRWTERQLPKPRKISLTEPNDDELSGLCQ